MSAPAIRAEDVGKRYVLGSGDAWQGTLRDSLVHAWHRLRTRAAETPGTFWALRDVGFEISEGECVGIVGRNGAGKSTLLKILSRITEPTTGRVTIRGRVASLLEVGTGFHPELTGRENVYLNGAVLGMRRAEIVRHFDEIVAFSEIEQFLDTPVKRYSSGMYMRLAFSVAAHLTSEVLVVDEVLAVGDVQFQKKCLGKIGEVSRAGRTVLFVSHNMLAVERLCQRAILLEAGRVALSAGVREVVAAYLGELQHPVFEAGARMDGRPHFVRARARPATGDRLTTSVPVEIELEWQVHEACPGLHVGLGVDSIQGIRVFGSAPEDCGTPSPTLPGNYRGVVRIPADFLLAGDYRVSFSLWNNQGVFDNPDPALTFTLEAAPSGVYAHVDARSGLIQVRCEWTVSPRG